MRKSSKFKVQSSKFSTGFTIIELLVVMVIIITVGVVIGGILFSALRGSNKSKAINNLETNGNYVMSQISKIVRFSKEFDGISTDGLSYSTNCSVSAVGALTPTPTPVAYKYIKVTSYDTGQTVFSCDTATISSNSASMLDTTTVAVSACSFMCSQSSPSDYPTITIKFTLSQYQPTGTIGLPEQTTSANFQTTIIPRNFNR